MSYEEFIEWRVWSQFQRIGIEGEEYRIGTLISCLPFVPADMTWRTFFPDPFVTPEQLTAMMEAKMQTYVAIGWCKWETVTDDESSTAAS